MTSSLTLLPCVILLSGPNYWLTDTACYTEHFQFLLIQLMIPPFYHGSQNSTVASVIVVYRVPGLCCSLQVTGFVRIKLESLAPPAQSAGLSYRRLRMCVCMCVYAVEQSVLLHTQGVWNHVCLSEISAVCAGFKYEVNMCRTCRKHCR